MSDREPAGAGAITDLREHDGEPVVTRIKWESISDGTKRLAVPGGWLYSVTSYEGALALEFVTNPELAGEPRLCGHGYLHVTCGDCRIR